MGALLLTGAAFVAACTVTQLYRTCRDVRERNRAHRYYLAGECSSVGCGARRGPSGMCKMHADLKHDEFRSVVRSLSRCRR